MRKNFLLLMLMALLPLAGFAQTSSDGFLFVAGGGNTATITGFAADVQASEVATLEIPYQLTNGVDPSKPYKVTAIAANAFSGATAALKNAVTSVTIQTNDGVGGWNVQIGDGAFAGLANLETVSFGKKVNFVGVGAFANCAKLATVNFPTDGEIATIGENAFKNTKIEHLNLTNTKLTVIQNMFGSSFAYAEKKFTADEARYYNDHIVGKSLDNSELTMDQANLYNASKVANCIAVDANAKFSAAELAVYDPAVCTSGGTFGAAGNVSVDEYNRIVKPAALAVAGEISAEQAAAYDAIVKVLDADSKKTAANVYSYNIVIAATAKRVTDQLTQVEYEAYNDALTEAVTAGDTRTPAVGNTPVAYLKKVTLPATWTQLGIEGENQPGAFENCIGLTEVVFPTPANDKDHQNQAIMAKAFLGCPIQDLDLSNSYVKSIPSDILVDGATVNSTLKTVKFPYLLQTIKTKAFYQCALLNSVDFPANCELATVESFVFGITPSLESISFENCYKLAGFGVYTPFVRDDLTIKNTELTTITLPNYNAGKAGSVKFTTIGTALANLVALTTINNLGDKNVNAIVTGAFENDAKLTELTFNQEVGTIQAGAFEGCTKLATLSINGKTNIAGAVFTTANTTLTTLKITGDVTGNINAAAFANCSAITSLEIAKGKEYKPVTVNAAAFKVAEGATIEMGQLTSNPSGLITALGDVTKLTLGAINGNLAAGTAIVTGANIAEVTVGEIKAGKGFRADVLGQAEKITFAAINNALTATTTANDALKEIVFNGVIKDVADMIPAVSFDENKAANLEKVTYTGTPENMVFNIAAFGTIAKNAASEVEFTTSTEIAELYGVAPTNLYRVFWKADPVEETIAVAGPSTYKYGKFFVPAGQTYEIAKDQDGAKVVVYEAYADKQGENVIYVNQLRIIDGKFFIKGTNANLDQNGTAVIVKSDSEAPVIAKKTLENKNSLNYTIAGLPVNEIVCQETSILGSLLKTKDLTDGTHNSDFALYAMMKPATNGLAWKQFKSSNTMPALTFYVRGDASIAAPELKVVFTDGSMDDVTAIKDINAAEQNNGEIFNLQGIRVNGAQKGIFIQNGKKVVIK